MASNHWVGVIAAFAATLWAATAAGQQDLPRPVAYWPMEEGSGNVARDVTDNGHDLELAQVEWTDGAIGRAIRFKGARSRAGTPLTDDLQPRQQVSVEAWVRVDAFPQHREGIGLVNAGNSYLLRMSGESPSFHIFTDHWRPVLAFGALRLGKWYHLVGTYDGQYMCIYVNGQLARATRREGLINRAQGRLVLGRQVDPLTGCLDEVRIYRVALSAEQVAAAFAAARNKLNPHVQLGTLAEPAEDIFGPTRTRPAPQPTLKHLPRGEVCFVVISDTHIGTPGEEGRFCHNWRVEEAIRQINALSPDFVVHLGDIITAFPFHKQYEDQCRNAVKLLSKFKPPVHLVAGNHDIGNQRNMRVWSEQRLKRIGITLEDMLFNPRYRQTYQKYFGRDFYSFQRGRCYFIVFNDEICNSGLPIEEEQMRWLEAELQRAQAAKAIFVFSHNPLFWNRPDEPGPKNYEPVLQPARSRLLDLFARYRVTAIYTGHTHFAFANEYRGVHMRTLNSTTFNRNYAGVPQQMSGEAQIYDPYKLGYLVVRVRDGHVHESWVPLYWRVEEPPAELASLARGRTIGRPATEIADGVLAIRAVPPQSVSHGPDGRELINDHWWRLAEDLGATWVQAWPPAESEQDWRALRRALTLGHPRGAKVAVPVGGDDETARQTLQRLGEAARNVGALIVLNGAPQDPRGPLTSWNVRGDPREWAEACQGVRKAAPPGTQVVLARLPLLGQGAVERIQQTAAALKGKADGLCVWMSIQGAPEEAVAQALHQAARLADAAGLELWLDTASWQRVDEPLRSACFLRLLALCTAWRVRLFWWIGPDAAGGLLDHHWDPTALYYAAQSWTALTQRADQVTKSISAGGGVQVQWQDSSGARYVAWWRPDQDVRTVTRSAAPKIPAGAIVADPLHGRLLEIGQGDGGLPVCAWPLVARVEQKAPTPAR